MTSQRTTLLAWTGFLSLLLGVLPLVAMTIGLRLEKAQLTPVFSTFTCQQVESADPEYQQVLRQYQNASAQQGDQQDALSEAYHPQKCRIAGSGTATLWLFNETTGWIYAKLTETQRYDRVGYRSFFLSLSGRRWMVTGLIAVPWLPILLGLRLMTGSARLLPWRA